MRAWAERGSLYARLANRPEAAALILLLMMSVGLSLTTSTFLTVENLTWVAHGFSFVAIAAIGMLLVMAVGDIDLSVGSQIGLAAIIAGRIEFYHPGTSDLLVFVLALASGAAFGLINAIFVSTFKFNAFIATLATGYIGRGLVVIISENQTLSGFSERLQALGQAQFLYVPLLVWIMFLLGGVGSWILRKTVFGKHLFATGGNAAAARLSGVPVERVRMAAFVLCGVLSALAGFLMACRLGVAQQSIGLGYEMDIIAAAVIGGVSIAGGKGTILGVIIGAAAMAVIRNGLVLLQISSLWQLLATGCVIVVAVSIDSLRRGLRV